MEVEIQKIIKSKGFTITNENFSNDSYTAMGIGDLLISFVLIKANLISPPIVIDINYYINKNVYPDPLNALNFRLDLIEMMIKNDDIKYDYVKFTNNKSNSLNEHLHLIPLLKKEDWSLKIDNRKIDISDDYIVFHTKCRFLMNFNYKELKTKLVELFSRLKTKNKIILLGERKMISTNEALIHGITTIYDELLNLKNNNDVVDMTVDTIYNNLDINNYINDISIIKNAKKNIIIGCGGQFVTSIVFNCESVYSYTKVQYINFDKSLIGTHIEENYEVFSQNLEKIIS